MAFQRVKNSKAQALSVRWQGEGCHRAPSPRWPEAMVLLWAELGLIQKPNRAQVPSHLEELQVFSGQP